jgi:anti-sigma-K factor RskA
MDALAPLYALDALDGEDLALFTEELKGSESLRAMVNEYRDAATALPLSLEPVTPPPAIKSRLMEAIAPRAPRSAPVFTRLFWAAAAVALISTIFLSLKNTPDTREIVIHVDKAPAGRVLVSGQSAHIVVAGLPKLPAGRVYQLWHIGSDKIPVPQGTFTLDSAGELRGSDRIRNRISADDLFAFTMEPTGGSRSPTLPIYAIGKY